MRAMIVCGILNSCLCIGVPTLSRREVNDGNLREEE